MSTCANCSNDAMYVYTLNQDVEVLYCATHVPNFLKEQMRQGLLPTVDGFDKAQKEAIFVLAPEEETPASRKKTTKKVEEPTVAENETVEEPVVEAAEEEVAE